MPVYALGFFDGVHLGHGALLNRASSLAAELGDEAVCLTFDRHPGDLLGHPAPLLSTPAERAWLMRRWYGVNQMRMIPFDQALMDTPWEVFAGRLLTEYQAAGLVCGEDYRFGAGARGTAERLRSWAEERGVPCRVVPQVCLDGAPVSSTRIRAALEAGDLAAANRLLGHPHLLCGAVVHGKHLGSQLGFPTANLPLPANVLCPTHGVYAARVTLPDGSRHRAVTNIGLRPTVEDARAPVSESWILDYQGDLYDRTLQVELLRFLRPEIRFPSVDALREQVLADARAVRSIEE